MNLDREQTLAVNTVGTNVIVSASAGAGKTGVLVQRLIKRCVKDRVRMDEILAVTFTAAAAGEMKNRVAKEFSSLLTTADEEEKVYLNEQMTLLDHADITTIDSFCLNIIRKYYTVIGLDPSTTANILDESSKNRYMNEAFKQALAEYEADHHAELSDTLFALSARSEDFDSLFTVVTKTGGLARSTGDADAWLNNAKNTFRNVRTFKDIPADIREAFFASIRLDIDIIEGSLERMRFLASDSEKAQ